MGVLPARDLPFLPLPYELRLIILQINAKRRFQKRVNLLKEKYKPKVMEASYEEDCLEWRYDTYTANFYICYTVAKNYIFNDHLERHFGRVILFVRQSWNRTKEGDSEDKDNWEYKTESMWLSNL